MRLHFCLFALLLGMGSPAFAQTGEDLATSPVPYRTDFRGLDKEDLLTAVEGVSRLKSLQEEPPAGEAALNNRAEGDLERIRDLLRSEGYYAASVTFLVERSTTETPPTLVRLDISPGPAFTLESYEVRLQPPPGFASPQAISLTALGVKLGERAQASLVTETQKTLISALASQGYPLAKVTEKKIIVDHATHVMRVSLITETGPLCRFGEVSVAGLTRLDPAWVHNRLPWKRGERFSPKQMEELHKRLVASGLFSSIKLSTAKTASSSSPPEPADLPISITLTESPHRSIGSGVKWSTSEGVGAQAFWENRNFAGGAEQFRASAAWGSIRSGVDLSFRSPDFLAVNQDLVASAVADHQRTDAFTSESVSAAMGMEWRLTPEWRLSAGTKFERLFEDRDDEHNRYTLLSFPLAANQDSSDDRLDPGKGNRFRLQFAPFLSLAGESDGFSRVEVYDSHYVTLSSSPRVVLAGWGRMGLIFGAETEQVPSNKRFFEGGGGSVRAYGFQHVGPVNAKGNPVGGLSALAFGGEVRINVTESIGIVPFLEGGSVSTSQNLMDTEGLLWGGGLGVRYVTPIGPLRLDVAVPFEQRAGDDAFQLYLSLGQAF